MKEILRSAVYKSRSMVLRRVVVEAMEPRLLMTANPFTPGDIAVYRVGAGSGTLATSATAVFLDEYTPGGTLVQSIALPTSGSTALTAGGTATSEGQLTLSPDGSTLALTGYAVSAGSATQGTDNGTVALVGPSASPAYYVLPSASVVNGNNIRTAVVDGNNLYVSGAAAFIQYAGVSSLTSGGTVSSAPTQLNTTVKNGEDLQIFNGQLYFSTQKQSAYPSLGSDSVGTLGTGEPTTGSQSYAGVADTSTSSYSFFLEHLGGGAGTANTLYVADSTSGIEKYSLISGAWTAKGAVSVSGGAFGITGTVDGSGNVHILATNAAGLYALTDTSGQSGTLSGSATKIASPATNEVFDGVAPAPDDGVGAITGLGGTVGYSQGAAAINPASAARFSDASNFDGGQLVVSGGLAGDTLGIASGGNNITLSGSAVSYNGAQIGVVSGGNGATALTIAFNAVGGTAVTSTAVQALINQATFSSTTSSASGNRALSFQVTENNGAADAAVTQTVNISANVSAPPSINALGAVSISENSGQQTIALSGIQHNGGSGAIMVTASSDTPSLIPNTGLGALAVTCTSPGSTGVVTFTPATGASGTAHVTVTVADSAGPSTATETVNVIAPPVNTVPAGQDVAGNFANSFSTANGNLLSIADSAVGASTVQVTLSVNHGTLALGGVSGLTFIRGANGQGSFTVAGTIAALNTALNGLTYTPTTGYAGTDTLQMVTNDLGHTASGSAQITTSTVALTVVAPPTVLLNEIEANPPGTDDNRYEYVELSGTPGQSLNNVYFVAFDGAAGDTGTADLVVNLSSESLGSDGMLVIQSFASTGHSIPAATTLVSDPTFFTKTGGFLNGSLSFFLFDSPNTAFTAGTDYDTNDDGTLDHLPVGAVALDHIAIPDTNNPSDIVYGGVEVIEQASQNSGTADAVTRFPGNFSTTNAAWYGGELFDTGNVDSTIDYDVTRESANEPANAYLTPGEPNYPELPVFNPAGYSFSLQQSAGAGTQVGAVSATAQGSDTLAYSLSGAGSANFAISGSGAITVAGGALFSATSYSFTAAATDDQDGDMATAMVTVTISQPPTLASSQVGDGSRQRSTITSIIVVFSEKVNFSSSSFTLQQSQDDANWTDVSPDVTASNPSSDGMTWVISCNPGGSLDRTAGVTNEGFFANGIYQLTLHGSAITDAATGAAQFNAGSDQVVQFSFDNGASMENAFAVLYGDSLGAAFINATNYGQFKNAFGSVAGDSSYVAALDYYGNGFINALDYGQFKKVFGLGYSLDSGAPDSAAVPLSISAGVIDPNPAGSAASPEAQPTLAVSSNPSVLPLSNHPAQTPDPAIPVIVGPSLNVNPPGAADLTSASSDRWTAGVVPPNSPALASPWMISSGRNATEPPSVVHSITLEKPKRTKTLAPPLIREESTGLTRLTAALIRLFE